MKLINRLAMLLMAGALLAAPGGCYNSELLVERARNAAMRARLEEVPLGYFRTNLPRDVNAGAPIEVELDLFVTTKRYRIPGVERQLRHEKCRLRQAMLAAIRLTTAAEMSDPQLTALRERLSGVAKQFFVDPPIDGLGIRQIRFIPL
jgi:hypothetical protein